MQAVAKLDGTDKDLAAVAQAMAATLPGTPSKAAKAANVAKGGTGTGAARAAAAVKKPSKAVVEKPAAPVAATEPKATKPARAAKAAAAPAGPVLVAPGVYMQGTHSAILVSVGTKVVNYIAMDSAGLELRKASKDKFAADWKHKADYAGGAAKAAAQYLASPIMKTPQAESMLTQVAGAALGKALAKGTVQPVMSRHDEKEADAVVPQSAKAARAAATGKVAPKPAGRAWDLSGKKLALGEKKPEATIRAGTLRLALMDAIVAAAKKGAVAESVLGAEVMPGKPKLAKVDVEFAIKNGFVKVA